MLTFRLVLEFESATNYYVGFHTQCQENKNENVEIVAYVSSWS